MNDGWKEGSGMQQGKRERDEKRQKKREKDFFALGRTEREKSIAK
jgi:hypothetical protein